jgi:N-acyl-D-amino-acid deacylase
MSLKALETGLGYEWPFGSFEQYMDTIERRGTAINLGALVGHTPVRLYVMGAEATERSASADEVAQMKMLVRRAIDAGAIGFATSKSPTHVGYSGKPVLRENKDQVAADGALPGKLLRHGHARP